MDNTIMNHLETFKGLLSRETEMVSGILSLENEKYDALKLVDVNKLMRINAEEEELLQSMDIIEVKRKELIVLLADKMGFNSDSTLSHMLEQFSDEPYSNIKIELLELRDTIKKDTENLRITMKENSEMIKANLEIINLTLNFANRNSIKETYNFRNKKESKENIYIINQIA